MIGNAARSQQLGEKRLCLGCGTKFYDLGLDPIICPKCKTQFIPPALPESEKEILDERIVPREVEEVSLDAIIVEEDLDAEGDEAEDDTFVEEEEEEEELSDLIRGDMSEDDEA